MQKYTILPHLLSERHIKKKRCYCKRQLCHRWFIPTRENQETCLFDLVERDILHLYIKIDYGEKGTTRESGAEKTTEEEII